MSEGWNIAVLGATGAVGEALLETLAERQFPVGEIYALARNESAGEQLRFGGKTITVQDAAEFDWTQAQLAFFVAGKEATAAWVEEATNSGCLVIDSSGLFALEPDVPLVVPEVNPFVLTDYRNRNVIAVPDSLTSQLLAPLCLLNLGITDRKLLPYWRFDTQEAGDLSLYADALPKLAPYMRISRQFVHERLKLPVALDEGDVFRAEGQDEDGNDDRPGRQNATARLTVPAGDDAAEDDEGDDGAGQDALDSMCDSADAALAEAAGALLGPLFAEVAAGLPPEELEKRLADLYPAMDAAQLTDILTRLLFVAQLEGRSHEDPH